VSIVCGALFGLAARLTAADYPGPAGVAVLGGFALLAGGLALRRGTVVTAGLALLGVGYGLGLIGKGLDPAAVLFAGGLVAVAELAFWALEPGAQVRVGRAATGRRLLVVGGVVLGSTIACMLLVVLVDDPIRGGAGLGLAGVVALAAIAAVAFVLARSLRRDSARVAGR
jgi:hypothetical protein